jgi:hypothetical protein
LHKDAAAVTDSGEGPEAHGGLGASAPVRDGSREPGA